MRVWIVILSVFFITNNAFSQEYEMGFSPFYALKTDNLNSGFGGEIFVNFVKKRPMVLGVNIGIYNTTTNSIHGGEFSEFDDDFMIRWIETSIQYNRKTAYIGAGIGYYITNYKLGEDIENYFDKYNILGSSNITNEFGFNLKGGINIWLSEKSYINMEIKSYHIEPTLELKLTDLNTLQSVSKDESGSFGTILISIGYGMAF